jgi:heme o synthase
VRQSGTSSGSKTLASAVGAEVLASSGAITRKPADIVRAYVGLTKPRIIELLLVTTVPAMIVAQRGLPDPWLVLATLIGGALAAASANTINSWFERDIDGIMGRTAARPLVRRAIEPRNALIFGIVLGVVSVLWLATLVNPLSAALALAANLFYVFVYTMGLKRRTAQNIVIGGAAGCVPVLVGWAAVTGQVELPAWALFAIVFAWTPPHFWALALRYREDYARAGVPMLPVIRGVHETARLILLYSVLLVTMTLLFGPVGRMGALYIVTAVVLGGIFIAHAVRLFRDPKEQLAMRLFHYSITYLGLLFTTMAVDAILVG